MVRVINHSERNIRPRANRTAETDPWRKLLHLMHRHSHVLRVYLLRKFRNHLHGGMQAQGIAHVSRDTATAEKCRRLNRPGAYEHRIRIDTNEARLGIFTMQ